MKRKKIISLILIISIIIQSIIYLINPSKVYGSNENIKESVINTTLGTVTLKTTAKYLKAGDVVPVEIYVGGTNIRAFGGYLNYDNEIFEKIEIDKDVKILEEWGIQDVGETEFGTEIFIYANSNANACSNTKIATLYFTVLKDTEEMTDITIKFVNLVNTDFQDNMDENYNLPDITISIGGIREKYNVEYDANTTEVTTNMPENEIKEEGIDYTISSKIPEREGYRFLGWNTKEDGTGTSYNANDIYNIDENVKLYAQWKEKEKLYLSTDTYKIGNENISNYEDGDIYISRVEKETTKEEFIANLNTNGAIRIIKHDGIELEENELIGTGMILEVTKDEEKISLKIAVMGDLDGNGKVTATDLSTLNQTVLQTETLENEYKIAGDLDENEKITATDLSTLNQMILGIL